MTDMKLQDMKLTAQWAGHENARHETTGHENARQETSSEAENVWGWIDWVVCYDSRYVEDQRIVGLIHRLEQHYLLQLQRLVRRLLRQRRYRRQQYTTAVRCVWSGNETASHLSRAATRVLPLNLYWRVTGVVCFSFFFWLRVLDKAEYSAFESTLNSSIVSYCVDRVVTMSTGCPICRAEIQMVMRVYNWICSYYNEFRCL